MKISLFYYGMINTIDHRKVFERSDFALFEYWLSERRVKETKATGNKKKGKKEEGEEEEEEKKGRRRSRRVEEEGALVTPL